MAKIAPKEGPMGIDRWTSNGYGLVIDGKKVEPPKEKVKKYVEDGRGLRIYNSETDYRAAIKERAAKKSIDEINEA